MPTLIMASSPKFITCPDCGTRYDNARKRRLIDTCGHPRCYSCLFVDKPCPLCEKLPKHRTSSNDNVSRSNESLEKVRHQRVTNLKKDTNYVGSHPNLSELHKARSSTLPPSFRQDSYFRSLCRYEPHGSSENLSTRSTSPTGRPRSLPPSYHESIENLNEQFWKSVELTERKWSPKKKNKKAQPPRDPKEKSNSSSPEVVECPAPDVVRLPVPSITHPKSQLEHHLRGSGEKINDLVPQVIGERPRSFSDINKPQRPRSVLSDATDGQVIGFHGYPRPLSWSPTQFPINNGLGSRTSSVTSRDSTYSPTRSWSPHTQQSISKSDRFSDSSSYYLSDTWSESSDSDSVQSPTDEKNCGIGNESNDQRINTCDDQSPKRYTVNPLANVTYWVVDSGRNSVHKGYGETDTVTQAYRPKPKVTHWNGQTNHSPNATIVSVHTEVSTL
ncbi:hypothetical protein QZH41_011946 [Actinostola sp. cb2023]|nr:hypothetical protein QZH41_011946 [Actinostola sp. cb2023]